MTGGEATIVMVAGGIVGMTVRELPGIILEKVFMRSRHKKEVALVNGNGTAGEKSPSWWRETMKEDVKSVFVDTLEKDILPVLNQQTQILSSIAQTNSAMKDGILVLVDRSSRGNGKRR